MIQRFKTRVCCIFVICACCVVTVIFLLVDRTPEVRNSVGGTELSLAGQLLGDRRDTRVEIPSRLEFLNESYVVPNVVFYFWCSGKVDRWFEYRHYLSVMSVIRFLRPDTILFYYDEFPAQDTQVYNTWIHEIKEQFAFFQTQPMNFNYQRCSGKAQPDMTSVLQTIASYGGIYIKEDLIIADADGFIEYRKRGLTVVLNFTSGFDIIMARQGIDGLVKNESDRMVKHGIADFKCSSPDGFSSLFASRQTVMCVSSDPHLRPKDIWEREDPFAGLVRKIVYGSSEALRPVANYTELIPNIAHMVWIGGGEMDFLFYLGVMSLIHVAKVDAVYIHGERPPSGFYWNLAKNSSKVHTVYRKHFGKVYDSTVAQLGHVSDVWRADIMLKYGGIYMDTDAVMIRPLDLKVRGYDAVTSEDWPLLNHAPFPGLLNFGVTAGKRNSRFWRLLVESMKYFRDGDWTFNGVRQPYKIKERFPDSIPRGSAFPGDLLLLQVPSDLVAQLLPRARQPPEHDQLEELEERRDGFPLDCSHPGWVPRTRQAALRHR